MSRKPRPTRTYYYRGMIEFGATYRWVRGYSANGDKGGVLYPWWPKRECQSHEKALGRKAVFVEEQTR